jgi:hypothetical protein
LHEAEQPHEANQRRAAVVDPKKFIAAIAGAAAFITVFWYGVLTLLCSIVYDPIGVVPREVGLSWGAVLAQAGAAFAALLSLGVVYWLAWLVLWQRSVGYGGDERILRTISWLALVLIVLFTLGIFVYNAKTARNDIREGRTPDLFMAVFSPPWRATVAEARWAATKPQNVALPPCLLYLGQADGTVVLYQAASDPNKVGDTFRLPAASVIVVLQPEKQSCTK